MKKLLLLIFIILSATAHAAEQPDSITVSGKVFDEADNTPLATCFVGTTDESKQWNKVVVADSIGAFSIKIPANSTLFFKYIGMQTEKVELGDTDVNNLEIRLHEDCNILRDWVTLPTLELFVEDKDGIPIKNAFVAIINPKNYDIIAEIGKTDSCGYLYWFNNNSIKKGKYLLLVETENRNTNTAKFNLKKKHSVIHIKLDDPYNTETIEYIKGEFKQVVGL